MAMNFDERKEVALDAIQRTGVILDDACESTEATVYTFEGVVRGVQNSMQMIVEKAEGFEGSAQDFVEALVPDLAALCGEAAAKAQGDRGLLEGLKLAVKLVGGMHASTVKMEDFHPGPTTKQERQEGGDVENA